MKVVDKTETEVCQSVILTAFLRTCWSFRVADCMCSIVASIVGVWLLLAGSGFLRLEFANTEAPVVSRRKENNKRTD
jgi:hypothetical protein